MIDDMFSRLDGPALEVFYPNGSILLREWYIANRYHRLDGPAIEYFSQTGDYIEESYWLEGKEISEPEHRRVIALRKLSVKSGLEREVSL
jgi:hypothetical protein